MVLDLTKTQLAAVIGTIPETLSRVLLKLSQDGLIELNGSKINVLDRPHLQQLSQGQKKV
jgi:CRP/FNR family transcriptional regulator